MFKKTILVLPFIYLIISCETDNESGLTFNNSNSENINLDRSVHSKSSMRIPFPENNPPVNRLPYIHIYRYANYSYVTSYNDALEIRRNFSNPDYKIPSIVKIEFDPENNYYYEKWIKIEPAEIRPRGGDPETDVDPEDVR